MSLDLDQVLCARAGWRKAILVPLWIFQVAVLLCLMGIFAYRLAETFEHYEEHNKMGELPIVEVVWEATNVGFNLIALILNILEIARKATERLTPFLMVCTHIIKLTLALAVLALDIVAYLKRMDGHYSTIGLALDCGLLAATLATFIYSVVTYRRLLKYEDYHLTTNAAKHGGQPYDDTYPLVQGKTRPRVTTEFAPAAPYSDSTYPSQTQPHLQRLQHNDNHAPSPTGVALKREAERAIGAGLVGRSDTVVLGRGEVAVRHPGVAVAEGDGMQGVVVVEGPEAGAGGSGNGVSGGR